ncbi:hypothetical protein MHB81_11580 [Paenibacillus sp. FSL H7-0326]
MNTNQTFTQMFQITEEITDAVGNSYPIESSRFFLVLDHVTQTWQYDYVVPAKDFEQPL